MTLCLKCNQFQKRQQICIIFTYAELFKVHYFSIIQALSPGNISYTKITAQRPEDLLATVLLTHQLVPVNQSDH